MKEKVRKLTIILTNLFASAAFTVITPFYASVAERSGIPSSLVGFIFSLFPISSMILSLFLPKLMFLIGRNNILIIGLIFIGAGSVLVSFIENCNTTMAILLSILSRILSGAGCACETVTSLSILSSDYPEEFQKLAALIETFAGLGIIIGPLLGSVLFSFGGFSVSCRVMGIFVLGYIPLIFFVLGKSREYVIEEGAKISLWGLMKNFKIFLNFLMGFCIMFAIGVTMPTIEPHVISYGIKEEYVGYWYIINTGAYFFGSFAMAYSANLPRTKTMLCGIILLIISLILLGPCPYIFPRNIIIVGIGHHIMGWSGSIIFSISYLVPLMPYLIDISHREYSYPNDDRLNDAISSIVNISICCGEISGPIFGSLTSELFDSDIKYQMTYALASLIIIVYAGVYYIYYKYFDIVLVKKVENIALEEEMIPIHISD